MHVVQSDRCELQLRGAVDHHRQVRRARRIQQRRGHPDHLPGVGQLLAAVVLAPEPLDDQVEHHDQPEDLRRRQLGQGLHRHHLVLVGHQRRAGRGLDERSPLVVELQPGDVVGEPVAPRARGQDLVRPPPHALGQRMGHLLLVGEDEEPRAIADGEDEVHAVGVARRLDHVDRHAGGRGHHGAKHRVDVGPAEQELAVGRLCVLGVRLPVQELVHLQVCQRAHCVATQRRQQPAVTVGATVVDQLAHLVGHGAVPVQRGLHVLGERGRTARDGGTAQETRQALRLHQVLPHLVGSVEQVVDRELPVLEVDLGDIAQQHPASGLGRVELEGFADLLVQLQHRHLTEREPAVVLGLHAGELDPQLQCVAERQLFGRLRHQHSPFQHFVADGVLVHGSHQSSLKPWRPNRSWRYRSTSRNSPPALRSTQRRLTHELAANRAAVLGRVERLTVASKLHHRAW